MRTGKLIKSEWKYNHRWWTLAMDADVDASLETPFTLFSPTPDIEARLIEIAATQLHQHGPLNKEGQTSTWQSCSRSDAHGGAARDIIRAVLAAIERTDT